MLTGLAKRLLRSAVVYDLIQYAAGERQLQRRLERHLHALPPETFLVDIGGGTGLGSKLGTALHYVCLDIDLEKLQRFRAKRPAGLALVADATHCPLKTCSLNSVLCAKVTHHLSDAGLNSVMAEAARIIKPDGILIVADAIWSSRWISRILWRLDRGSFPRSADDIRRSIPPEYLLTTWEEFRISIFHDFVLCTARKHQVSPGGGVGNEGGNGRSTGSSSLHH
jgi:SAM-dependent methyltransferase